MKRSKETAINCAVTNAAAAAVLIYQRKHGGGKSQNRNQLRNVTSHLQQIELNKTH